MNKEYGSIPQKVKALLQSIKMKHDKSLGDLVDEPKKKGKKNAKRK